jgi:hypothetical protein
VAVAVGVVVAVGVGVPGAVEVAVALAVAVAVIVAVAVGVAVTLTVGVADGITVGLGLVETVAETSLEAWLSIITVLYAVTTKKYVPLARFWTVVAVVFPTSISWE